MLRFYRPMCSQAGIKINGDQLRTSINSATYQTLNADYWPPLNDSSSRLTGDFRHMRECFICAPSPEAVSRRRSTFAPQRVCASVPNCAPEVARLQRAIRSNDPDRTGGDVQERPAKKERKKKSPDLSGLFFVKDWRREPESNRPKRLCRPLHNRFAIAPQTDWNLDMGSQIYPVTGGRKLWKIQNDRRSKQKGKRCFPDVWSGRRGSNSRPQPWQGCALPTELLPH